MKKQLLLLVMMLLPMAAMADAVEIDGIYYNLITKGCDAEVTKNPNNYVGNIEIPSTVFHEGVQYDVIYISDYAFSSCTSLTSVTIPSSVKRIGYGAFSGCGGLKSVKIFDLTAWCNMDFRDALSNPLRNNYLDPNISYPNPNDYCLLFINGIEVKDLEIPNNVSSIGKYAFIGCRGLNSVNIGNNVTSIGDWAFSLCYELTSVNIGNNVTSIGEWAFSDCINLPSVKIPDRVYSIGLRAFQGCTNLTSIIIGCSTRTISYFALADCPNLTDVYCYATNPPNTQGNTFDGSYIESSTLYVPESSIDIYKTTVRWKNFGNIIKIDMPKHNLIYMIDDVIYKEFEIEEGEIITPENAPIKEGHTFSGWSEIPETMPAHDVTVTGTFTINKYELTYTVDGEEYKSYELDYGATITPEAEPTKEGYTFSGWSEIPETMPAHDVTVTGTFSINKYKLTYTVDGEEYKSYELDYGATITPEAEPTKEGYTFSGWSEIPETMPDYDIKVFGSFSINRYTLSYEVDGLEYKIDSIEYGKAIAPEEVPTKEGYTFSGWSEIPETMPAHDVTVSGTFTINKYKVTYMVDGVEYKTVEVEYGSTITPEASLSKEGYTFSGWTDLPETMPAHDVTVTGTFTINKYKVTYIVDGEEYGTSEVVYGAEVNPIEEPSKEGYTFSGWLDLPEEMPAHDVTVSGTFTVNKYKVTFMYGDNVLTTIEVNYGEAIELPESLNSERYTLIEWKDVPESMPAHDVVIYADYVDGINTITADSKNEQYIRINGMYTNELKQGVNIIRTQDGKTRKVWVK